MTTTAQSTENFSSVQGKRERRRPYHAGGIPKPKRKQAGRRGVRRHQIKKNNFSTKKESPYNQSKGKELPPVAKETIRIIPLGGVEEVGRNMTVIEYEDDIIVVDFGFQFSEAETPGIDFILPNPAYLEKNKDRVRAIFITHGHYDHIGAIPYLIERVGNPIIYSREFGALIIKKRQTEFPHVAPLNIRIIDGKETISIGKNLKIKFFAISHAIPDSMGLIIKTPVGNIAFIEDVRVDHKDSTPTQKEIEHYALFKKEPILLLTMDSTSIEKPGFSIPESRVIETIDKITKEVSGRLIIGTFASQVERVMELIKIAQKYNKKVVIDGRSMKNNVEIVRHLKLIKLENIIPIEEMENYPPNKIVVIATGAQGEEYSVFDRIANKAHRYITLNKSDTILFSASIIPGNENAITKLKDNLYRQEAKIITYADTEVHSSGHGNRGELEWIHKQIKYKFFMPVHGHHFMLRIHAEMAQDLGVPASNIVVPDNGSVIEIRNRGTKIVKLEEKVPSDPIMVDGISISGMQEVVLRDRKSLAEEGIFIIIATINIRTGKLRKSPDIISRGFVYLRESQELLQEARLIIKKTIEETTRGVRPIDFDHIKGRITEAVSSFLFQKTAKTPVVIPVVLGL